MGSQRVAVFFLLVCVVFIYDTNAGKQLGN